MVKKEHEFKKYPNCKSDIKFIGKKTALIHNNLGLYFCSFMNGFHGCKIHVSLATRYATIWHYDEVMFWYFNSIFGKVGLQNWFYKSTLVGEGELLGFRIEVLPYNFWMQRKFEVFKVSLGFNMQLVFENILVGF